MSKEEKEKKEETLKRMESVREKDNKQLRLKFNNTLKQLKSDERSLLIQRDELQSQLDVTKNRIERVRGAIIVIKNQLGD